MGVFVFISNNRIKIKVIVVIGNILDIKGSGNTLANSQDLCRYLRISFQAIDSVSRRQEERELRTRVCIMILLSIAGNITVYSLPSFVCNFHIEELIITIICKVYICNLLKVHFLLVWFWYLRNYTMYSFPLIFPGEEVGTQKKKCY